jgi:uncharacterized membrane protein
MSAMAWLIALLFCIAAILSVIYIAFDNSIAFNFAYLMQQLPPMLLLVSVPMLFCGIISITLSGLAQFLEHSYQIQKSTRQTQRILQRIAYDQLGDNDIGDELYDDQWANHTPKAKRHVG